MEQGRHDIYSFWEQEAPPIWTNLQDCHFCKEKGHIKPHCKKWELLPQEDKDCWNAANPWQEKLGQKACLLTIAAMMPGNDDNINGNMGAFQAHMVDVNDIGSALEEGNF